MLIVYLGCYTLIAPSEKSKDCSRTRKNSIIYQRTWLSSIVKDIRKGTPYRKVERTWWIRGQNRSLKRALIPDRQLKIAEPESKPVKYFQEDSNLSHHLEGKRAG